MERVQWNEEQKHILDAVDIRSKMNNANSLESLPIWRSKFPV